MTASFTQACPLSNFGKIYLEYVFPTETSSVRVQMSQKEDLLIQVNFEHWRIMLCVWVGDLHLLFCKAILIVQYMDSKHEKLKILFPLHHGYRTLNHFTEHIMLFFFFFLINRNKTLDFNSVCICNESLYIIKRKLRSPWTWYALVSHSLNILSCFCIVNPRRVECEQRHQTLQQLWRGVCGIKVKSTECSK